MRRTPAIGALLLAAGVTSALVGPAAADPPPLPPASAAGVTIGGTSQVVPMDQLDPALRAQFDALHANDTPVQKSAQLAAADPSCYPYGTEVHNYWIRYQFDSGQVPGPTAGSARVDKVWHDDCYQVLGELQGPGLSALMSADLTVIGQTEFNQPTFPAAGVYEWHKYRSDQSTIAYPHGMHSYKRTVVFDFKSDSSPSPFSRHVTMGMDSYAGLNDYFCWFRDDVDDFGNVNAPRGEGCQYVQ